MASIIKKKKKNQVYYYLVESARVNGKPRIVRQKYLGRAEHIAAAMEGSGHLDQPKHSIVFEFGAVMAIYDLAQRLGVVELLNAAAPKRKQGLSVGEYMLLAAINRAVDPKSKHQIAEWFAKTTLDRRIPATSSMLSSQRFWDNMNLLSEDAIQQFEDQLTRKIVQTYGLSLDCLIYDTTNFFTFIDTNSSSALPQRGKSKEKRADLKIVGLAMMVSPDFSVPLFHETYPGNHQDATQFRSVIKRLTQRCQTIGGHVGPVTLVFDKGNNSADHMKQIQSGELEFRVVGSLRLNQSKSLMEVGKDQFQAVSETRYKDLTAYRSTYEIYGQSMTVLVVYNPELKKGQLQGIETNTEQCAIQLHELQCTLEARESSTEKRGRKPTLQSVQRQIDQILHKEFMKDLFDTHLTETESAIKLDISINFIRFQEVQERQLGKTILYTDNHEWSNEKIISTYRSQYHIEDAFKQMKNTDHLGFRPMYHWTDQKIKVHAFYCVLALRLCCLLNRELHGHGLHLSINRMLEILADIKQVITVYPKKGASHQDRESFSLSKLTPEAKKIMEVLGLDQYRLGG